MTSLAAPSDPDLPPIAAALDYFPLVASVAVRTTHSFFRFTSWLVRTTLSYSGLVVLSPLASVLSASLYIFAPVIVFAQVLLDIFVFTPYGLAVYFVDAMYPVYVFCGVACITGVIIGGFARWLVSWITEQSQLEERSRRPIVLVKETVKLDED